VAGGDDWVKTSPSREGLRVREIASCHVLA